MVKQFPKLTLIRSEPPQSDGDPRRKSAAFELVAPGDLGQAEQAAVQTILNEACPRGTLLAVGKTPRPWDLRPVVAVSGENEPSVIRTFPRDFRGATHLQARVRETFDRLTQLRELSSQTIAWGSFSEGLWYRRPLVETTLAHLLAGNELFTEEQTLSIVFNLAEEVLNWHDRGVVHGHIASSNVFVARNGKVALLDPAVGLALNQGLKNGSDYDPQSFAPEVLRGQTVAYSSDIYGVGLVYRRLFLALSRRYQFEKNREQLEQTLQPYMALANAMLDKDPLTRPALAQIHRSLADARRLASRSSSGKLVRPPHVNDQAEQSASVSSSGTTPAPERPRAGGPVPTGPSAFMQSKGPRIRTAKDEQDRRNPEPRHQHREGNAERSPAPQEERNPNSVPLKKPVRPSPVPEQRDAKLERIEVFKQERPPRTERSENPSGRIEVTPPAPQSAPERVTSLPVAPSERVEAPPPHVAQPVPPQPAPQFVPQPQAAVPPAAHVPPVLIPGAAQYQPPHAHAHQPHPQYVHAPHGQPHYGPPVGFVAPGAPQGQQLPPVTIHPYGPPSQPYVAAHGAPQHPYQPPHPQPGALPYAYPVGSQPIVYGHPQPFGASSGVYPSIPHLGGDPGGALPGEIPGYRASGRNQRLGTAQRRDTGFLPLIVLLSTALVGLYYYRQNRLHELPLVGSMFEAPPVETATVSNQELTAAWESKLPSRMMIVAEAALARPTRNRFAESLILNSVMNGDAAVPGIDVSLLRVAFDPSWEASLNEDDRRVALTLGLAALLRDRAPLELASPRDMHPGVLLALVANSGKNAARILASIPAERLTKLPPPYGPAFKELIEGDSKAHCGDEGIQHLARMGTRAIERTDEIPEFLSKDTDRRLRALALMFSQSNAVARPILDILLRHPNISLEIQQVKWARESDLGNWSELDSGDQLMVLAGFPPSKVPNDGNLERLLSHPAGSLRALAIQKLLDRQKFAHPGSYKALKLVESNPILLSPKATAQLVQMLKDPSRVKLALVKEWTNSGPPQSLIAELLLSTHDQPEATELDAGLASYLNAKGYKLEPSALRTLSQHPDRITRLFAYNEIYQLEDHETSMQFLSTARKTESDPELMRQLDQMLLDLSRE